ncbi:MAG TPA: hypothetical protein PLG67_08780 [Bacillota bacterium]|nr:hypothetical protein [Bacillota bacterium]HQE65915.1 hypothetical protein [Bacillota bacterium]HQI15909.1 hypothetical protein [Bacillota bacterium]HQJ37079.1 hypothetical protein [Bacillota bacterium]HQL36672.1 hypothetical protein [Bacillota bacterium]
MSPIDKELIRMVRRIRDRLHAAFIINSIILGLVLALCLGIGVAVAARFVPIYNVYLTIFKIAVSVVLAAFLYSAFKTPRYDYAALKADSIGLQERTVTALELIGSQSAFAVLEKNDALAHLKGTDYKKRIPLKPNNRYLLICVILTIVLALSGFIPNPMAERAEELHSLKEKITQQQKKADKLTEKVKNNPKLSEEQKKELEAKLSELKQELKEAKDEKEISKALGRAEKKLEYIKDKYSPGEDLKKIVDVLSKNKMTEALADMIKNGDERAFKENIKEMAEALRKLSTVEKQKLAEELTKLAQEIKNNPELSKAFAGLAEKLASGELGDISSELGELDKSISELMENESIRNAISELAKELGAADSGGHQGQGNTTGGNGQQGQGNQPGGSGQGSGQGSGAGSGTDMGNENQAPIPSGSSGISKKDGSVKKDGEYEKIFTPQTIGGEGTTSNLSGKKGTGGTVEQVITDKSRTVRGTSVPYNQIIGQYKERAMESISISDIPPGMKDMVKEYFTSLED